MNYALVIAHANNFRVQSAEQHLSSSARLVRLLFFSSACSSGGGSSSGGCSSCAWWRQSSYSFSERRRRQRRTVAGGAGAHERGIFSSQAVHAGRNRAAHTTREGALQVLPCHVRSPVAFTFFADAQLLRADLEAARFAASAA